MKKNLSMLLGGVLLSAFLRVSPAMAFGWPTFDIAEVANTIFSGISQIESQISTAMETYSIANIQQSIGDKLGGLQKIKDVKAKLAKEKEKLDKIKKRAEKVMELKRKYEQAAKNAINQAQDAYSKAQGYVDDAKNQINNAKNQVEGAVNNVKNQVENVKNQVEDAKNQVEGAINGAKDQIDNIKNQAENAINNANNQFSDLFGNSGDAFNSPEDNFNFENTPSVGGGTSTGQTSGMSETVDLFGEEAATVPEEEEISWDDGTSNNDGETSIEDEFSIEKESEKLKENETEKEGELSIEGRTKVKAFGKTSFYLDFKKSYASGVGGFKTGTDDDGTFYFPDAFAQWTGINFDDEVDEDKFLSGVDAICADLQSSENHETQEFDNKFDYEVMGQMRAAAHAHSAVRKNEADNGKTLDDLRNMNEVAGGTTMTQTSGFGEIGEAQVYYNKKEIVRLSDEIFSRVFEEIRKYCYYWPEEAEEEYKGEFVTATSDTGTFYLPQEMAQWCNQNIDKNTTKEDIDNCVRIIANDYYSPIDDVAHKARIRFRKMKMEAVAHAFITAHEAKKKFATDKTEEAVEKINTEDTDNVATMDAGNAAIKKKLREQEDQLTLLKFSMELLDVLDTMQNRGDVFVEEGGSKQ